MLSRCVLSGFSPLHDLSLTVSHIRFGATASCPFILPVQGSRHVVGQALVNFSELWMKENSATLGCHNRLNYLTYTQYYLIDIMIFRAVYELRSVCAKKYIVQTLKSEYLTATVYNLSIDLRQNFYRCSELSNKITLLIPSGRYCRPHHNYEFPTRK